MSLTRRRFIESASLTLLASAALPTAFAQRASGLKDDTFKLEDLTVLESASEERFKPLIGESFAVLQANRRLDSLTLLSVTAAAPPPPASKVLKAGRAARFPAQAVSSFSLRFQGSGASSLAQGTYTLKSDILGSFPLFLVPGGTDVSPHTYTAVFSLLMQ